MPWLQRGCRECSIILNKKRSKSLRQNRDRTLVCNTLIISTWGSQLIKKVWKSRDEISLSASSSAAAHILGKGGSLIRARACRCEGIFIMPLPLFVCTFHTSGGGHLSSQPEHTACIWKFVLTLFIDARCGEHLTWSTFRRMVDTTPVVLLQSFNRGNCALTAETN